MSPSPDPSFRPSVAGSASVHPKKGAKFSLIITSMCICLFLSALEFSSVSTALPTIANALHSSQFTWVGSAYVLASTAFLPMSGGLAQAFGRRYAILMTIGIFALGSAICGVANNMTTLIVGRAIQGLGGGGIQSLTSIILADLVTLQERGAYAGLYALTWCIAVSVGPVIGGSLATQGQWRWLFYLNLPISLVACMLVIVLLDLPTPSGSYREKVMRMDWIGNFLVISSTAAYTIALTWGGITAPWDSAKVLVPLVLGLIGLGVFIAYEAIVAKHPIVPFSLMKNMTSISGYIQTLCAYVMTAAVTYYVPVYFQACKGASPIESGVYFLALTTLGPTAITAGLLIKVTGRYRPPMWIGWIFTITGLSLMSTIREIDPLKKSIGYLALLGGGVGILNVTPTYPIQAPLPVTQNASALSFMWFLRLFGCVWGITVGSAVLQNELTKKLPAAFLESVPQGTAIAYALIPQIATFPSYIRSEVQVAFADSLAALWRVLAAISGAGFVAALFMRSLPLQNTLDADWAMNNEKADDSSA